MDTTGVPRQLEFVWFTCPKGHDQLIDWAKAYGQEPIACFHCDLEWFVDQGQLGEVELIKDAYPNLQG